MLSKYLGYRNNQRVIDSQIRSFIAIELPDELKAGLIVFQKKMKLPGHNFVRWVSIDGIHITLKFLGNVTPKQIEDIQRSLEPIAQSRRVFTLHTAATGVFPNLQRMRVFWLGLNGDIANLIELQHAIDASLLKSGFEPEKRPFTPHLTLARLKDDCRQNERWEFGELIKETRYEPIYYIKVEKISLMRSQLLPGGAVYSKIAEFKLQ